MKIHCAGAGGITSQIDRLKTAFVELGHALVEASHAELIYCNDPGTYSEKYRENNKGAIIVYNVLDYPPHILDPKKYDLSMYPAIHHGWKRDFDVDKLTNQLKSADIITTICDHVTWQVKHFSGLEAKTIHNPIKPISNLNLLNYQRIRNRNGENYKYLAVGRLADPNKRSHLIITTLGILGESSSKLATAGTEDIRYGDFYGELSDENLNLLFNSVEYLFLLSGFRSIGLPALEAISAGIVPIVANDCPTTAEFFGDIAVPPNAHGIAECIKSEEWNTKARKFVNDHSEEYKQKFSPQQICKNILKLVD